jgi:phosphoglycolate phosphatase-like HAD superfamily hydrolase
MKPGQPTIVFDWNCTLLDDIELVLEATNALLAYGRKPPIDLLTYQTRITLPLQDFYRSVGFSAAELEQGFAAIQDVFHDYYEARVHTQQLRHGAVELLAAAEAAGVPCLILSNHLEQPIRVQLERLNIHQHFAEVLAYADRATQFKHESKGQRLQRFMVQYGLSGADCVIIGDTAEEQHIAQELGMTGVALTGGFFTPERLTEAQPHHLLHGLDEFHGVLRQRGWLS